MTPKPEEREMPDEIYVSRCYHGKRLSAVENKRNQSYFHNRVKYLRFDLWKTKKMNTLRALTKLQRAMIEKGCQGTEPDFMLLRQAIDALCEGDTQVIAMECV